MPSTAYQREWAKRPENRLKKLEHKARIRYGISRAKQLELYATPCEICNTPDNTRIDHRKSEPGTYRGVLCNQCNTRLGWFERNREVILTYVDRKSTCPN